MAPTSQPFHYAIARRPAPTFADGLTSAALGAPSLELALAQHASYVDALERCGVRVVTLDPDPRYPDSTFVEDTAVIAGGTAVLTRPGASSRRGEVLAIREALGAFFTRIAEIAEPGTVDGGDVCEAGDRIYIGLSERTNESGAEQLAGMLEEAGFETAFVDIRDLRSILHLKSGLAYLGEDTFVVVAELAARLMLRGKRIIQPSAREAYAANCVRVNDAVLVPEGFPELRRELERAGFATLPLDVGEYRKMDGGLSCLSLRF
ncbi:MAG TPA: arginine deiminase family protein [Verrucomicrobiae bacterium]|nr:arginine deiminase family protein [Verrucomicrobiae bacterium]